MRKFSSYGPVSTKSNYYVPRNELIGRAINQLLGSNIDEGGHFFTVWAARQTGKTWLLNQVFYKLSEDNHFYCLGVDMQKKAKTFSQAANYIIEEVNNNFQLKLPKIKIEKDFYNTFSKKYFDRPLLLILDEFDDLNSETISQLVTVFRSLYINRNRENTQHLKKIFAYMDLP